MMTEIYAYLEKIVNKEAFDQSGLIYGMGHAVYTLSDPRAVILKEYARSLSEEKGLTEEFMLYSKIEQLASELLTGRKNLHKPIAAMSTFTADLYIRCSAFRRRCLLRSLRFPVSQAGRHTGLRSS